MIANKIKGVLFDLDDTLFDCSGQLTSAARLRAAEIIVESEPELKINALTEGQETLAQTLGSGGAIAALGKKFGLAQDLVDRALAAYNLDFVEDIVPFPDALECLRDLTKRNYSLALVTSGSPIRQCRKVELLGFSPYFREDNGTLVLHDDRKTSDKTPFMQQAAAQLHLNHGAVLAVGDKLDSEIASANQLGMTTVRMRHGRQKSRVPQTELERPDFEIDSLLELLTLLR